MFGHYYSNSQPIPKSPSNALVSRVSCSLLSIFLKMFLSVAFANSCNDILFLAGNQLYELQSNRRGWWGQKKPHCNFCPKQWLLSIDMKTKLVQHVESDWMRDWKSVRVRKSEIARESESEWDWGWVLSIEMKTKVVQHVKSDWMRDWMSVRKSEREWECDLVPSFCLTFRHF